MKKLLLAAFAAMLTLCVHAQSWTASEVGAGNFYLYNVGKGQFLTRGNGWGTQASASANSALTVTVEEYDGAYKLRTNINGSGKGLERLGDPVIYTDQSSGKNSTWTFTKVADGSNGPIYTIVSKDNHGGGAGSYMTASADNTIVGPANAVTDDYGRWQLVQCWITNSVPVNDATGWTTSQTPTFDGGNVCAEYWNKSGATIKQTVSNLPKGSYELIAVAFTRTGMTATLNAGTNTMSIATVGSDVVNGRGGANTWFNNGNGVNKLEFTLAQQTASLEIGLTADNTSGDHWLVWRSFVLIYKGVDLTEFKAALQAEIDEVPALETTTTAAAYNAAKNYADGIDMDALTTEEAISTALSELTALVDAAKALQTNYANYNAIKAEVLALDDDATVYTGSATVDVSAADATIAQATTVDAVNAAINQLRTAAANFITSVTVNENKYFDVTNIWVINPTVSANVDGWNVENVVRHYDWSTGPTTNFGETEFYQSGFDFNQSVTLPAGTWEFGVTGFHRAGTYQTYFYAGEDRILLPGESSDVVNSMADAKTYFDNGNGKVALKFLLEGQSNTIKIGIINEDTGTDRWTIFRNFTLKYYGAPDYSVYDAQWADAVTAANDAKTAHPIMVEGVEEYNALNAAIADAPDGSSKANYLEKIGALEAATTAFITAATTIYEAYPAALTTAKGIYAANAPMRNTVRIALNDTITAYDEGNVDITDKKAVQTALDALNAAIANAEASIAIYVEAYEIIHAADDIYDEAGRQSYLNSNIISGIKSTYTVGGLVSITDEQKAAAQAALATACKAQVQPKDGCDMTPFIVNPGIDGGSVDGWTCVKTGDGYMGGPYQANFGGIMEFWGASTLDDNAAGKGFDYYQMLSGLPSGAYTISADMLNSTNGEEGANWNGGGKAGLYGKTASNEVQSLVTTNGETFLPYTTDEILVVDGELRIGVKNIAALTGRWFACDNFKLTYARQLNDEEKEAIAKANAIVAYNAALAAAQAIAEGTIPSGAYTTLQTTITNNTLADGTSTEYNAATAALNEAATAAAALVDPYAAYKAMKANVNAMTSVEGYTETNDATTTLTSAIGTADAIVEAATTAAAITDQTAAVKAAGLTFLADVRSDGEHPFNITFLITNPGFDNNNIEGWTRTFNGGSANTDYHCNEFYNNNSFDFYQTLTDMPKGNYELKVQAFQRPGWAVPAYNAFMNGNTSTDAVVYINNGETSVKHIAVEAQNAPLFGEAGAGWPADSQVGESGSYKYIPNSMEGAEVWFNAGYYDNSILTAVDGTLRLGFKADHKTADGTWTLFDNFRLYYYGQSINVAMSETEAFAALADIEGANVTMARTTKVGFNTVALPFDLTAAQVQEAFGDGAIVYAFSENSADPDDATIEFNVKAEQTIEANEPVLVKATAAATQIVADNVTVKTGAAKVEGTNIDFVGNYGGQIVLAEGLWFVSSNTVYKSTGNNKMKGFRAYIQAHEGTTSNVRMFIDGLETSISEIDNDSMRNGEIIYNMAGQRVSKAQKGLYIVNGRKVIVK